MKNFLSVFRNSSGEKQVLEAYDSIMDSCEFAYEDLYLNTRLGSTHIIACGPRGAQPIILVHAFFASAASWYLNIKSLSEHYRVYAVDMIGDPNKSKPFAPIRLLADYVDWFNDIMNRLEIVRADFVGNSVGAFHILNFAINTPARIKRMILIGPAASFLKITPFYLHTFPGGITGWTFFVKHAVNWIENGAVLEQKFRKLFILTMQYGRSANKVFPLVFEDHKLKQITTPILLVYGNREAIYNYDLAILRAKQCLQNLSVEIIRGANHLTAVSAPVLTNRAILNFLGVMYETDNGFR